MKNSNIHAELEPGHWHQREHLRHRFPTEQRRDVCACSVPELTSERGLLHTLLTCKATGGSGATRDQQAGAQLRELLAIEPQAGGVTGLSLSVPICVDAESAGVISRSMTQTRT